jgi:hypothetical protein
MQFNLSDLKGFELLKIAKRRIREEREIRGEGRSEGFSEIERRFQRKRVCRFESLTLLIKSVQNIR